MKKLIKNPADLNRKQASTTVDEVLDKQKVFIRAIRQYINEFENSKKKKKVDTRKRTIVLKIFYPGRIKSNLCPVSDEPWKRHECYKIMTISPETVEYVTNNCTIANKHTWYTTKSVEGKLQLFLSTLANGNRFTYESIYE